MAKPAVTKGVVKPKTGQAGLYGGLGPNAYVNQLFAPQEQATAQQQASRQAVFQGLVKDFLDSINGVGKQLAPYTAAAGQQSSDAKNAAAGLAAANPNAVTQNDLRAIGAPQSQQDAVTAQNQTAFGGNAALLNYTGGVIPSDQFRSDAAARASYLGALPAIGESIGLRGLGGLNSLASKENLALQGNKTQALQTARTDLANYVQKNQAAKADAAKTAFDQNYKTNAFNATQTYRQSLLDFKQQGLSLQNKKYNLDLNKAIAAGARPNAPLSKVYGHVVNINGETIPGANGKPIPIKSSSGTKPLSADKIGLLTGDANRIASNALNGFTDTNNKKHPKVNFGQALAEMRMGGKHGTIPLVIGLKAMRQAGWKIPAKYTRLLGGGGQGDPLDSTPGIQGPNLGSSGNPLVAYATRYLGIPYSWGGGSPSGPTRGTGRGANTIGYDCSSFIQAVMVHAGWKNFPRTTYAQAKVGQPVSLNQLQPGDAVFTEQTPSGPGHVGLYIGNGMVQESPHTGDVNKVIDLQSFLSGGFVTARRYLNG